MPPTPMPTPPSASLAHFPDDSHPPITYPVAILKDSTSADAAAFLEYLRSANAAAVFAAQGFIVLK